MRSAQRRQRRLAFHCPIHGDFYPLSPQNSRKYSRKYFCIIITLVLIMMRIISLLYTRDLLNYCVPTGKVPLLTVIIGISSRTKKGSFI